MLILILVFELSHFLYVKNLFCMFTKLQHLPLIFFIVLLTYSFGSTQNIDIDLLRQINVDRNLSFDQTFKVISDLNDPLVFSVPLVIYGLGMLTGKDHTKKHGIKAAASLLVASMFSTAIKYSFRRDRPSVTYSDIIPLSSASSPSFPSGHTTIAFATATSLSLSYPKWYVIAPAYLWAGTVGYSRMHLGVHYPSDVVVGMIVGSGSAYLTHYLMNKFYTQKSKKTAIVF